eukprot:TRINITY_DN8582_c0_g1_i1.p1 TRINITY_DN8582_c0_g1~~TRINITY_DN8582_c0_g1_i1.p1  ORF type:complete len:186 (-),score=25.08 TRINITY_DN8582_c0_g1_i1:330-887(-)
MEDVAIQDDRLYASACRVRNTFIELIPALPALARCTSEPKSFKCSSYLAPGKLTSDKSEDTIHAQTTCVIVRDLPCKVGSERMMAELETLGFHGCYDSLIFPKKGRKGKASFVGYGFIYFKHEDYALEFMSSFANHQFKDIGSKKVARAELARSDGEEGHIRRSIKKATKATRDGASEHTRRFGS